jgi:hypothetical protein
MDFKLKNPDCPPRDAQSVTLRKRMADGAARRKLARKTQDAP